MTQTVTRTLSEHESKRLLAAGGVPVLDERVVETPDEAEFPWMARRARDDDAARVEQRAPLLGRR